MRHLFALLVAVCFASFARAEFPRVLPEGKVPNDMRLGPLKDLDGYFPFETSVSKREWAKRSVRLRTQMQVGLGLWPQPTKTPLNAVVHGKIEKDDYTVERVYFESMPGFFVTGSLYRPKGVAGKKPGVLCPHGHWSNGRFYDAGEAKAKDQISKGAEKFIESARSPLQARCVHLARMGCVVLFYDMIGYADSQQIPREISHGFRTQRPEMNDAKKWGLFSPQAEVRCQNVMGLQTWNSIRSLDFLESLPDVDSKRLAVTGASGGGTQSMILAALDSRVSVSMPAVMVSTAMQGGCTCENCSLLRVGTGNIEFAALYAPKPQGLTAADDWTKELATKGFPQLVDHYKMLGEPDNIMMVNRTEFKHNYNAVSREAMFRLFRKHLNLGDASVVEREFERLTIQEATVWTKSKPKSGPEFERELVKWWNEDSEKQLAKLKPRDAKTLRAYREVVGGAVDSIVGRRLPAPELVEYDQLEKEDRGDYLVIGGVLRYRERASLEEEAEELGPHEEVPIIFVYPKKWESTAVIWIDEQGKAGLFNKDGSVKAEVLQLVNAGASFIGVDLFQQGEFLPDGNKLKKTRRVKNEREFAGYTFGYNHTVFARRVHDILTTTTFVRNHAYTPERVYAVGLTGSSGALVAMARAQTGNAIDRAAIDLAGFQFASIKDLHHPDFLPGGAKYGDVAGVASLSAPDPLWLPAGEPIIKQVYKAAGAQKNLTIADIPKSKIASEAVKWLLK